MSDTFRGRIAEPGPEMAVDSYSYNSQMKKSSVSDTKNNLSAILQQVQEGETFLIVDRGRPVARLEPIESERRDGDERRDDLERRGLLQKGRKVRKDFVETKPPQLPARTSALELLLEERREGR